MTPANDASGRSRKGEETRGKILEAALRLFHDHGYDRTTMRAVAEAAGVSLGNAYYYYESKEHLIQAFYRRTVDEQIERARDVLAREKRFEKRLAGVLHGKLDADEPYHRFSGVLFRTAADPESPLNPFSPESLPVRRMATQVLEDVVHGSDFKPGKDLGAEVPNLLWTYQMGVTLFWIFDRSSGRKRTRELVDATVPLVTRILRVASLPFLRPFTKKGIAFAKRLRLDQESQSAAT